MASEIRGTVQHHNSSALHKIPAFIQMVTVSGPVKTIYIGAQFAVVHEGNYGSGFSPADILIRFEAMAVVPQ
jgi:hypothetical protein